MPGKHSAPGRPKNKKGRRAVAIVLVCLILAGAAGGGGYYLLQRRANSAEVNVFPVNQLGYVNTWAERVQTGGTVRADKMQAVRLSNTQTVTEIFVQEGQEVKVGDKLLAFDTTLSEVELEKARIEIEKKKLDIQNTQKELDKIATYRVGSPNMGYYEPPATPEPPALSPTAVPYFQGGAGTAAEPYVFLWENGRLINDDMIRRLLRMTIPTPSPEPTFAPTTGPDDQGPDWPLITSEPMYTGVPVITSEPMQAAMEAQPTPVGRGQAFSVRALLAPARLGHMLLRAEGEVPGTEITEPPVDTQPPATEAPATEPPATEAPTATEEPFIPLETPVPPVEDEPWAQETPPAETDPAVPTEEPEPTESPSPSPEPSQSPEPSGSPVPSPTTGPTGAEYYMVFEMRDSNSMEGDVIRAFEIRFLLIEGRWSFEVVQPSYQPYIPETEEPEDFGYSFGGFSGEYYTAEEIARMRDEAKQKLLDLNLSLRVAEQELKEKEFELSNGEVLCTTAGVVKSVLTPEEALASDQPVVMISGGGGYFVTCYMSEFDLEYMGVGDTVTVEDYRNGATLEGTITEVSQYPAGENDYANYYYDSGNSNVSTYPFTIEVSEDADLREGYGVSVYYSPAEKLRENGENGSYFELDNMFVRRENGRSYVYTMDGNGLLEKRYLTTAGGDSWSTRIAGGLDMDTDYIAFPYGRSVKEGAKAIQQEDISVLYNGY